MTDLRYPIGTLTYDPAVNMDKRREWIRQIAEAPAQMRAALAGISDGGLEIPYRPGGWTIRQVAHHVADSHVNAYIRFKLALTEDNPTIKPYQEAAWAELADTTHTPVAVSLAMLDAVHTRLVVLLESMTEADFGRPLMHPENGPMTLDTLLQMYAWHGRHHVGHIKQTQN